MELEKQTQRRIRKRKEIIWIEEKTEDIMEVRKRTKMIW